MKTTNKTLRFIAIQLLPFTFMMQIFALTGSLAMELVLGLLFIETLKWFLEG